MTSCGFVEVKVIASSSLTGFATFGVHQVKRRDVIDVVPADGAGAITISVAEWI